MVKSSLNHPAVCEKYRSGCMWGLISFFDFHQGRTSRKLLSDRRRENRRAGGTGYLRSRRNLLTNFDANCQGIDKIISILKHDQLNGINLQPVQMSEAVEAFINQNFIDRKGLSRDGVSQQPKQFLGVLEILNSNKELFLKLLQYPNSLLVKCIQDLQDSQAENDPTKSFSEIKLSDNGITNGRNCEEPICTQKQNVHKPFWKMIKFWDRYKSKKSGDYQPSTRMVVLKPGSTDMQNFETNVSCYSSPQSHNSLRNKEHSVRSTYFSFGHIKRKLKHAIGVCRKEKHWNLVVNTLHRFPYDCEGSKEGSKGIGADIVGRNSPCRTCSDIDRTARYTIDVKRSNKICKAKDFEWSMGQVVASASESAHKDLNLSTVTYAKQGEPNVYVEAKRHLSKMLSSGVEDESFSRKQVPTTLGRILSSREYEFTPTFSPGRDKEHGLGTAQMRHSPCSNFYMANEKCWQLQEEKKTSCLSPLRQNVEAPPCAGNKKPNDQLYIFDSKPIIYFSDTIVDESISDIRDDSSPKDHVKIVETSNVTHPGKSSFFEVSSKPISRATASANQSTSTAKICEENGILECSRLDSPLENQPPTSSSVLSSSSSLSIQKVVDLDSIRDEAEQPSPVSVLEPFCTDNATSPARTISQTAELPVQPLQINFEENYSPNLLISPSEPKINFSTCMEDKASTSEWTMELLQASGLNWDELAVQWHSSDKLLDQSLFDKMELLPVQSCGEPKLLFDCINEVLLDVCQRYFGCFSWASLIKLNIQPVSVEKMVVHEVMNSFDGHLLLQRPLHALEHLIVKDMEKSTGMWMDTRIDTEDIRIEMVEASLEELIIETIVELQI